MSEPFYRDDSVTLWHGDAATVLAALPAGSVDCCITSPPYYGLRDYGTGRWVGGDETCEHSTGRPAQWNTRQTIRPGVDYPATAAHRGELVCEACGAIREDEQIGAEPTPAAYIDALVDVFAHVRRVLADDGTLWINIGDSYASSSTATMSESSVATSTLGRRADGTQSLTPEGRERAVLRQKVAEPRTMRPDRGPKNMLGIPWRLAFALQDDGWILRNAIIWHKPNAMPESVTDRLSATHELVFMLSKSRRYWFDLDPIRVPLVRPEALEEGITFGGSKYADLETGDAARDRRRGSTYGSTPRVEQTLDGELVELGGPYIWPARRGGPDAKVPARPDGNAQWIDGGRGGTHPRGRNPGDVWSINTRPFADAHFATFPPEIPRRCIAAGCRPGGVVLDPFHGSGTTGMVAAKLGRRYVGVDLNAEYLELSLDTRLANYPLMDEP